MRTLVTALFTLLALLGGAGAVASFAPPQQLDAGATTPTLDSSFRNEAWLVFTYDIDAHGQVVNVQIHSSNGVPEVEQAVRRHINGLRFRPATRDGQPVKVAADPIFFTWIIDQPRNLSAGFADLYARAWALFKEQDYDGAFDIATQLKEMPGRNAFEEVKLQILAASLASRWDDPAAELQHLGRAVELQALADRNHFNNPYIDATQYQSILERIHNLQLERHMLGDAGVTLERLRALDPGGATAKRAAVAHRAAQAELERTPDMPVAGELVPIYRDGPGNWKTALVRDHFSLSAVSGNINGVFLVCASGERQLPYPSTQVWSIPAGSRDCKVEISGRAGTRFTLHQLAPGASPL